ncbi:DNA repair ATPase [Actinocorallia longicatena]|uniref:DNA repair ATPase n=1 Tax=Actinocorallia longicatena TaxID=111803 RepID=A0ABP6QMA8_9ACTN
MLRDRLAAGAAELSRRAAGLNTDRLAVFGGGDLALTASARLTTGSCVPRDLAVFRGGLLFGANGADGRCVLLRCSRDLTVAEPLAEDAADRDLAELYRYYRDTRLLQLRRVDGRLLAVFQTGLEALYDTRVLRWNPDDSYRDNLGDPDHVYPPPYDFAWTETGREDRIGVSGTEEIVAVGPVTVGTAGRLTVSLGATVHTEEVAEPLQSLADAEILHAAIGPLTLLRIRPYKEEAWRHLVCNTLTGTIRRLDGIGSACLTLPSGQGVIFPGGYCLATGGMRTFAVPADGMEYERTIRSANGEDVLYVFHERISGRYLLMPYNLIGEAAATPLTCDGYALFDDDGTLAVLRADSAEPARAHTVQLWRTPFLAVEPPPRGDGPLERIGNADLVHGIADLFSLARLAAEGVGLAAVAEACSRAADRYHWLDGLGLLETVREIGECAERTLAEAARVAVLTEQAAGRLDEAAARGAALLRREPPGAAPAWGGAPGPPRLERGRLAALAEVRFLDTGRLDALGAVLEEESEALAGRAVGFFRRPEAFTGYHAELVRLTGEAAGIGTAAEAGPLRERLAGQTDGLEIVVTAVGGLEAGDATVRTEILTRLAEIMAAVNRARATLDARARELTAAEHAAAYTAESALLGQAVAGALAVADTPERCDEQLVRLLPRLDDLDARFPERAEELAAERDGVYEALTARKQVLLEEWARRADRLAAAAERVLDGVARRCSALETPEEIDACFAADPTVRRVRAIAAELRRLGAEVRATELTGRLDAVRTEAHRTLRDRRDLGDGRTLRLGAHSFEINTQRPELTLIPSEGALTFTITGTGYRSPAEDPGLAGTERFWDQPLVSESPSVYRAEYLAATLLASGTGVEDALTDRYDEGYERGVHDHDAALVLGALHRLSAGADLLRYPAEARADAQRHWAALPAETAAGLRARALSLARAGARFGGVPAELAELAGRLEREIGGHRLSGEYLVAELSREEFAFVTSESALRLTEAFRRAAGDDGREGEAAAWLTAYVRGTGSGEEDLAEAIAVETCPELPRRESSAGLTVTVDGLLGVHPRIRDGRLELRLDEFLARTGEFAAERVPAYRAYQRTRAELVAAERDRLRLERFRPQVMGSFVRNSLIDRVYLPLAGDALARQFGAAGGLLLLVSPPGYGKSTLIEYLAARLGLVFVKVNATALGRDVVSLDPAQAPDAVAREELEKINFAFELGSNTMLYLDDVQHCSAAFLEKFVPLCDATRRVEGTWRGRPRTYDLRGRRFAVCMSGNPYTEHGDRFELPGMLASRADVHDLGALLSGREDLFALSYLENVQAANEVLAPYPREDLPVLVRLARGEPADPGGLTGGPGAEALSRTIEVLRHLLHVQEVLLKVDQAYVSSALRPDEPPFRLQGSYRDMNRLASRIVPAMTRREVDALLDAHYRAEAQTLGPDAEPGLLRLAELRGSLTEEERARWTALRAAHHAPADPLTLIASRLAALEGTLSRLLRHD